MRIIFCLIFHYEIAGTFFHLVVFTIELISFHFVRKIDVFSTFSLKKVVVIATHSKKASSHTGKKEKVEKEKVLDETDF